MRGAAAALGVLLNPAPGHLIGGRGEGDRLVLQQRRPEV